MLNILMPTQKYGILQDVVDEHTLDEWKHVYQKNSITKTATNDNCWGIDKKCLSYNWFLKKVMPVIANKFDVNTKLIFSSFIDLHTPLKIHEDIKPLPEKESGKHYVSILIPYSIDNNKKDNFLRASTRFYDQDKNLVESIAWKKNCLIWWDSDCLHDSGGFKEHNIKSKQYFITHTYV